jgi:hypothetical protein
VLEVCRDFDLVKRLEPATGEAVVPGTAAAAGAGAPAAAVKPAVDAPDRRDSEMFGAFSSRRKRFSFFWN